jgi:hypothetical protein
MGIRIGAKPDNGFDDPIGMLKDCHRRIEHFLQTLCVVEERAAARAMTEEEATAVKPALPKCLVHAHLLTPDKPLKFTGVGAI